MTTLLTTTALTVTAKESPAMGVNALTTSLFGVAPAGGGTLWLEDYFNEASDVRINLHTPDTGPAWANNLDGDWTSVGSYFNKVDSANDWLKAETSSTTATSYIDALSGSADLDIILNAQCGHGSTGEVMVAFRSSLTEKDGYGVGLRAGDTPSFGYWSAGVWTGLETDADIGTGTPVDIRLKLVGSNYTFWVGSILDADPPIATGTDAQFAAAGYVQVVTSGFAVHYLSYLKVTEL